MQPPNWGKIDELEIKVSNDISLKVPTLEDGKIFYKLFESQRQHLGEWLPSITNVKSLDEELNYIRNIRADFQTGAKLMLGIYDHGELIGSIGMNESNLSRDQMTLGYWIIQKKQGRGIMTSSAIELIEYLFRNSEVNRLELRICVENIKSRNLAIRLGFKSEGILREGEKIDDKYYDFEIFGLLRKEWKNKTVLN